MNEGDIFYESWGYDQTNVDFLQVTEVSATGKTVKCQMMGKESVDVRTVKPTSPFGVTFRLHVREFRNDPTLRGKYPFVQRDGEVRGWRPGNFWQYKKPVYETPIGMGH